MKEDGDGGSEGKKKLCYSKMADISPTLSVIALNLKDLIL